MSTKAESTHQTRLESQDVSVHLHPPPPQPHLPPPQTLPALLLPLLPHLLLLVPRLLVPQSEEVSDIFSKHKSMKFVQCRGLSRINSSPSQKIQH